MTHMALLPPQNILAGGALPTLTGTERRESSILILDPEPTVRGTMRQAITGLDYGGVSEAADMTQALQKIQERPFTHLIFDAKKGVMAPRDFLLKLFEIDEKIIAIPSSFNPTVDDVFDLLIVGAKGYLVKPFNTDSLDDAIVMATKGEPISEAILYAKNRNEALASLIFTALDKLAVVMRQARQFETASREIPKAQLVLRRGMDISRTFAKGGDEVLLEQMIEFCLERASGPATKLGRFRKRLEARKVFLDERKEKRKGSSGDDANGGGDSPSSNSTEPSRG